MTDRPIDVPYEVPPMGAGTMEGGVSPFAAAGERDRALLVGGSVSQRSALGRELRSRGWEVATCAGPARNRCPLLEHKSCGGREGADVTVVFTERDQATGSIACASHRASPAVMVLQGGMSGPRTSSDRAIVGSRLPLATIASTVEGLRP